MRFTSPALFGILCLGAGFGVALAQTPVVTGDARVDELLSRMTLSEKRLLIHDSQEDLATYQGQAGYIAGVPRLGIPGLRLADGPPGVLTRHPSQAETATLGLAATFDVPLAEENGVVIGREAHALGINVALQPFINIDRDLSFRRMYNTYGEDPLLTSQMGAAVIKGIQSQHVMAMAKHFIGYDGGGSNIWIDDQTLHEVYLPPFEAAVNAGVAAVMCSYNHINGAYACGNRHTLTDILRGDLGFKGFVVSDWGASHSALFMNAGEEVEMIDGPDSKGHQEPAFLGAVPAALPPKADAFGEPMGDIYGGTIPEEPVVRDGDTDFGGKVAPKTLDQALADGTINEATVTKAAGDILYQMDQFGFLDGGAKHDVTVQAVEANAAIIERTGEEAAVLLKNDGALPLKPEQLDTTVLIGPTAGQIDAIGINGERSLGLIDRQVSPLDAIKQISGNSAINFAVADDMTGSLIPARLLSHGGKAGLLYEGPGGGRIDNTIDFTAKGGNALPANTTAHWTGGLSIPRSGIYWLYLQALGTNASLYVDGKRLGVTGTFRGDVHGDILQANQDNVIPTTDGLDNVRRAIKLSKGRHTIRIEISPDTSDAPVQLRLNWYPPQARKRDFAAAVQAAKRAKIAIVFAWTRRVPAFVIPGEQNALVEAIAKVNPNTIVVLNSSQPVAMPWLGRVKAVLEMWWPGDEGGWATANLLLGKTSPSGRLPVTWAKRLTDYPATDPRFPERSAKGINGKTTYTEGVNVGYRWFDHEKITPLFPFGHGLSYTRFSYSDLRIAKAADGGLDLTFRLANVGPMDGAEVPQAYLSAPGNPPSGVQFPFQRLVAFDRVLLRAGESRPITLHVPQRQLQYWASAGQHWETPGGSRTVSVGASSRDLLLQGVIE